MAAEKESDKAYEAASAILTDCAAGRCENVKANDVNLGGGAGVIRTCCPCWNRHVDARRRADKIRRHERAAIGRAYWAERGVKVGDAVEGFFPSWTGFGGLTVQGIAKAGVCGAYVYSPAHKGQLAPDRFVKVEGE